MTTPRLHRGYTLLELIVSLALFSLVMVIVTGAYLMLINLDREVRTTNQTVSTLSFAVDSMARAIRTGSDYSCGAGNGTCSTFSFTDNQVTPSVTRHYCLKSNHTIGVYTTGTCNASTSITDPNITVDTLSFVTSGVGTSDTAQPTVVFTIHGTMPTGSQGTGQQTTVSFTIETSATQRELEL